MLVPEPRTPNPKTSLADAEPREDLDQQCLVDVLAGDVGQCPGGDPDVGGQYVRREACFKRLEGRPQMQ